MVLAVNVYDFVVASFLGIGLINPCKNSYGSLVLEVNVLIVSSVFCLCKLGLRSECFCGS